MNHLTPEILNALLDERLAPHARDEAHAHLATCAQCRAEFDALERVNAALDALAPEPLRVDLAPRVLARIELTPRVQWLRALVVAETIAIVALSVWLSETLVSLFDLLPDFGMAFVTLVQIANDLLNAITIEPLQTIGMTEWLTMSAAAVAAWLMANRWLIQFPHKEVV